MAFPGTYTALVTPFRDGQVDEKALAKLIDRQFAGGVTGIVPVGTTGESATLSHEEHEQVIALSIEAAAGRGPVIAGTGSNSTQEAISLTVAAEKLGANAALLVAPYYNKPSQEGLYQHYRAIAEATQLPLILYSIPGRCGIEIGIDTVARLATDCENIVALKEAGGSVERVSELAQILPDEFSILSGDDSLTLPFMAVGAVGVISVASNIIPKAMAQLVRTIQMGKIGPARELHAQYYPLFKAFLSLDTNPVPIKTALSIVGSIGPEMRLPLVPMAEDKAQLLRDLLQQMEILA